MRLHRISFNVVLGLGSLLACAPLGRAQTNTNNAAPGGGRRATVQQRVERMSSELNLNADQKTKVTALFEAESKKRQELRADNSIPREEKREKAQAMMAEQEKKLKEILTSDQFEKWQKMRQQFRPRRPENQAPEKSPTEKKTE